MSASTKKKLRKEQAVQQLTERQLHEQKEAKKLKIYTAIFAVVLAVMVAIALFVTVSNGITTSGVLERNAVAMTVGEHDISNAELSYFYIDEVNEFYRNYGSYASMFGLDTKLPLDQQVTNQETGATWADDFLASAKSKAQSAYALADAANAAGYTLSESDKQSVDATISNMEMYAPLYGYSSLEAYLKGLYGNGASVKGYRAYLELNTLANSYYSHYAASLTYEDGDLREAEKENFNNYTAYSYNSYYIRVSDYLTGGTTDESGAVTYSDTEKAAALAAAEADAKALAVKENNTVETLDAAIAALTINAEKETKPKSTANDDSIYTGISSIIAEWLSDANRAEGDIGYIASTSTSTNEDGTEETTVNGYYVVLFRGSNDNTFALANVRHILIGFEGGTTDNYGNTTYTDQEKAAAKTTAEELLAQWAAGEATEDSFAALVAENSTDSGSIANGGLYEEIYPGQMVANFEDWCFTEGRKAGDTGIVETQYGYHIMYYVGDADITYRDYMITRDLRTADSNEWYAALIEATTITEGEIKYIETDLILTPQH